MMSSFALSERSCHRIWASGVLADKHVAPAVFVLLGPDGIPLIRNAVTQREIVGIETPTSLANMGLSTPPCEPGEERFPTGARSLRNAQMAYRATSCLNYCLSSSDRLVKPGGPYPERICGL